jgi:hypothetical protein
LDCGGFAARSSKRALTLQWCVLYEHRKQKLLTRAQFVVRVARHVVVAAVAIFIALAIGIAGYHFLAHLPWIDSFLNAAMILGGMGPVDTLTTTGSKFFAGLYALFAGVVFIGITGVMIAPFAHRLLHRFHIAED